MKRRRLLSLLTGVLAMASAGLVAAEPAMAATPTTITVTTDLEGPIVGNTGFRANTVYLLTRATVDVTPAVDGRVCVRGAPFTGAPDICADAPGGHAVVSVPIQPGA